MFERIIPVKLLSYRITVFITAFKIVKMNMRACSENFVKSCSAVVIFTGFESNYTACKHRSIEFLTTQTDQSNGDILIDYVLISLLTEFTFRTLEY